MKTATLTKPVVTNTTDDETRKLLRQINTVCVFDAPDRVELDHVLLVGSDQDSVYHLVFKNGATVKLDDLYSRAKVRRAIAQSGLGGTIPADWSTTCAVPDMIRKVAQRILTETEEDATMDMVEQIVSSAGPRYGFNTDTGTSLYEGSRDTFFDHAILRKRHNFYFHDQHGRIWLTSTSFAAWASEHGAPVSSKAASARLIAVGFKRVKKEIHELRDGKRTGESFEPWFYASRRGLFDEIWRTS